MDGDWDGDGMDGSDDGDASSASASPPEPSDAEIYAQVAQDVQNAQAALTSGSDPSAGSQTPQINGGLLDPRTFPSNWDCGPAPAAAPSTGPVDPETYAEVQRDVAKAQSALQQPPASSQSPLNPEVEADVRAAQAALPQRIPTGNPSFRHIDPYPGMNYAPPGRFALPTPDDYANFLNGAPVPTSAYGPHITFVNDEPKNPSPDRPVTDATADMVERAVVDSGFNSVNINSTTGGKHDPHSNHPMPKARAVDIDAINGRSVSPENPNSKILQDTFARQFNIHENFGPSYQTKIMRPGQMPQPQLKVGENHQTHDHFSGRK